MIHMAIWLQMWLPANRVLPASKWCMRRRRAWLWWRWVARMSSSWSQRNHSMSRMKNGESWFQRMPRSSRAAKPSHVPAKSSSWKRRGLADPGMSRIHGGCSQGRIELAICFGFGPPMTVTQWLGSMVGDSARGAVANRKKWCEMMWGLFVIAAASLVWLVAEHCEFETLWLFVLDLDLVRRVWLCWVLRRFDLQCAARLSLSVCASSKGMKMRNEMWVWSTVTKQILIVGWQLLVYFLYWSLSTSDVHICFFTSAFLSVSLFV